ncbi:MAG: hypothetical protein KKB95_09410 [Gammaproteobacteria bacterium]|nr:hypothetical protein [Gammaproteobacteria bacterium]MBU1505778.1 hypothetical protein [Gammaproteobacteria bacterium]MBU2119466.1 hypothetical protein [Gammaproteobacteria bacterium]MBU2172628.1 hypothetical protein [Gammaproteobacteria bacterium]MBU2202086.1 hypothetical protein [Gammaproteobacteria bacterium]
MSAPKFIKKLAVLIAIETIVGTLVVPVAANAIEVSDVTLTPIEGDEVDQGVIKPYFGASETVLVTEYRKIAFSVGFAGVGTVGDLPGWSTITRACAASVTNTPAPDVDAGTVFTPVTDGIESVTVYAVIDKLLYKMGGARGNAKATVDAKQIPKWQFDFTGSFVPVEDVGSMPAVIYTAFQRPLGVNKINTTLVLDGFSAAASSFQFDFGNQVVKQDLMNVDTTEITGRVSTGSVTFRNTSVATKNWIEMARASAKVPLLLKHGQALTNTVGINVPLAQIGKPSFSDQDGIQMITVPYRCIPSSAGNDEWAITA